MASDAHKLIPDPLPIIPVLATVKPLPNPLLAHGSATTLGVQRACKSGRAISTAAYPAAMSAPVSVSVLGRVFAQLRTACSMASNLCMQMDTAHLWGATVGPCFGRANRQCMNNVPQLGYKKLICFSDRGSWKLVRTAGAWHVHSTHTRHPMFPPSTGGTKQKNCHAALPVLARVLPAAFLEVGGNGPGTKPG